MAFLTDHHDQKATTPEIAKCVQYCEAACITSVEAGLYFIDVTGQELGSHYLERLGASIEICSLTPDFLFAHDLEMYTQIAGICADACENCAEACLLLGAHDPFFQECSTLCQMYAQRCRKQADLFDA